MENLKGGFPAGGFSMAAMGWPPSGKTNLGPRPLVLHDAELAPRITETARGILRQMTDESEEQCPAALAGARLLGFTGMDDGGVIAGYDDGSMWVRPKGPAGAGVRWAREAGPAWTTAPARDRTLGLIKKRIFGDEAGATAFAAAASVVVFALGLSIAKAKRFEMSEALAREFYREHAGRPYFDNLLDSVVGACTAVVIEGSGSVQKWRDAIGPSDPSKWSPAHLRSQFGRVTGSNIANNGFHGSDSPESAEREIELLLPLLREGS